MHNGKYRIEAIDFTKGVLVILMVVYHALNYLHFGTNPRHYMAFLPHSFIMITGFIITRIYLERSIVNYKDVGIRLTIRAFKILLLFSLLNFLARMIWSSNHYGKDLGIKDFFLNWFNIYIIGDAEAIAFEVLVPISYTLFLAILILKLQIIKPYFVIILALIIFILCNLLHEYIRSINNLNLISSGLIGMALGLIPNRLIDEYAKSRRITCMLFIFFGFSLFFENYEHYWQTLITIICTFLIYSIGVISDLEKWYYKQINLLGQYSLISYIIQIFYLQLINKIPLVNGRFIEAILLIVLIIVLTWITVIIVDYGRYKNRVVSKLYNVFFL